MVCEGVSSMCGVNDWGEPDDNASSRASRVLFRGYFNTIPHGAREFESMISFDTGPHCDHV